MKISLSRWIFKPRLWPACLCLVLLIALMGMGHWQWWRAQSKEQLQDRYASGMGAQSLSLREAWEQGTNIQGFPIEISGVLDERRHFLLDNQMQGVRAGFNVFTPLATAEGQWVMVDRGWMPWGLDRALPALPPPPPGTVHFRGRVYFPSARQVVLKADDYEQHQWPFLIQKIDLSAMSRVLATGSSKVNLAPLVVRLEAGEAVDAGSGLVRQWSWLVMGPERHRAYAVQWWGMALTLVVLFTVFSFERKSDESI